MEKKKKTIKKATAPKKQAVALKSQAKSTASLKKDAAKPSAGEERQKKNKTEVSAKSKTSKIETTVLAPAVRRHTPQAGVVKKSAHETHTVTEKQATSENPKIAPKVVRVQIVKKVDVDKRKAEEAAQEAALRELEEAAQVAASTEEVAAREAVVREVREEATREATAREAAAKEAWEVAAREAAVREAAAREAREMAAKEAKEIAAREAAIREARKAEAREKKFVKVQEPKAAPASDASKTEKDAAFMSAETGEKTLAKIKVSFPITLGELAPKFGKTTNEMIKQLMLQGKMMTINQHLDEESAQKIARDFGFELEVVDPLELQEQKEEVEDPSKLKPRPPVVTVMGHVDHGKTSLLDALRQTNVTASEEGGITQRIGAYQVELNDRKITFLDTPGHEAFTAMRARGTKITDVAVLVVAADDGVMPQTLEAIDHAKAASVPIVVAVNKIDKPNVNVDRVKQQLSDNGLVPEEWGGSTVFVSVSAKQKLGLAELLEMILLVADLADLKANPEKMARGTIIEAKLDRGKGPVATALVQEGTLRVGDTFVAGNVYGKIRAFINDRGERIQEASPSFPVEIIGLNNVPEAGDLLQVVADERMARQIAEARSLHSREQTLASLKRVTLEDLYQQIQEGQIKDLNLIIKADGQGSVEALRDSLERLGTTQVRVRIIHTGVGTITESDVLLAAASNALIIGFNIRPEPHIKNMAEREKVDLRFYRVIYQAIEDITQAMVGMHKPSYRESVIGRVEVLRTFKISKVGTIAGCRVIDGKVTRESDVRVIRDGAIVYEGKLASLKRFKDDAKEVQSGFECGIGIQNFNDIKERDVLEAFVMEEVPQTDLPSKVEVS